MHGTYRIVVGVNGSAGGRRALRWALRDAARRSGTVVLGSHGHGRAHHAALGSVSEECLRYAACPVVIAPDAHPGRELLPAEPALRQPTT